MSNWRRVLRSASQISPRTQVFTHSSGSATHHDRIAIAGEAATTSTVTVSRAVACGAVLFATAARLAGCGPRAPAAQGDARYVWVVRHADSRHAWMTPDARTEDLLYVSSEPGGGDQAVYVYAYTTGRLKGKLVGFAYPEGLCVDKTGDVFVPDATYGEIFVYPHGSAKPSSVLDDAQSYSQPVDCSIDPATGNRAVVNAFGNVGSIAIFENAQGNPQVYSDPAFSEFDHCSYDPKGNLFIVGLDHNLKFRVAELPKARTAFKAIRLRKLPHEIRGSGGMKWDGTNLAIDDLYRSTIYQVRVRGSVGMIVGSTGLTDGYYTGAFWILKAAGKKSGPDDALIGTHAYSGVQFWHYPAGGMSTKTIPVPDPLGVAVSPGVK
jgi:hypothetical protein